MSARWFGRALCGSALVVASACSANEDPGCTATYSYAAVVTVVDATGTAVPDARVTYSQNGREARDARCATPGTRACTTWNVEGGGGGSADQTGTYVIRASSADGARSAEQTVTVPPRGKPGDLCGGPVTQQLTLTLK